ncbi:Ras guanine nucleotide exchange factor bud5 [Zalaria obscura]|uniref:Ras guanine nucleotide exchange factor bud5 n=1 Tax=Zalaria obscura TaxID=2024903 RepID=A0ACC3SIT0_9PEZI
MIPTASQWGFVPGVKRHGADAIYLPGTRRTSSKLLEVSTSFARLELSFAIIPSILDVNTNAARASILTTSTLASSGKETHSSGSTTPFLRVTHARKHRRRDSITFERVLQRSAPERYRFISVVSGESANLPGPTSKHPTPSQPSSERSLSHESGRGVTLKHCVEDIHRRLASYGRSFPDTKEERRHIARFDRLERALPYRWRAPGAISHARNPPITPLDDFGLNSFAPFNRQKDDTDQMELSMDLMTTVPAQTPRGLAVTAGGRSKSTPPLYRKYLRASHDYVPDQTPSFGISGGSSVTVELKKGDIILVHLTHANGWADGTVLTTGARAHAGMRRTRKSMLSDLSSLIKFQERIQEKVVDLNTAESLEGVLEGYLTKVFKVVNRAIIFLDFWIQNANESKKLRPFAPSRSQSISGPVLLQRIESPQRIRSATLNMHFQEKMALTNASDVECVQMDEKMPVELDTGNGVTSKPSHDVAQHERRTSSPQRTRSLRRKPSFLRHVRLPSWIPPSPALHSAKSDRSASDSLEKAHDRFLGEIGSFIGLHLQSRSSEDLVATTHKSLETGMEIVNILNEIWRRDRQQSDDIAEASQLMRMRLKDLASAAKELCNQSDPEDMPADTRPEEGRCLVAAATACVRSAGDCVTKAHQLLDRTGDFELDYEVAKDCATCSNHSASKTSPVTDGHRLQEKPSLTFRVTPLGLKPVSETVALASPIKMRNITHERPQTSPSPLTNGTPPRLWIAPSPSVADGEPAKEVTPTFSPISPEDTQSPVDYPRKPWTERERQESVGMSITGSTSTYPTSLRDSMNSVVSDSTRATTPDHSLRSAQLDPAMLSSFGSMASMRSSLTKSSEGEAEILEKTYAHELLYAKDGQIQGGTLRALVEKLTSSTATPDASFINAFYLTFRQFTNATELAKTLQERYAHVADSKERGAAARLRVCNFLKGWLEHHWDQRTDAEALQIVQTFAAEILRLQLPTAAQRLVDLCEKASHQPTDSNPAVSVNSKTGLSGVAKHDSNTFIPLPDISKGQLNISHAASAGKSYCSILDFEPLELARQLTLIDSDIFCAIQPDELLGLEFTKRTDDSRAIHVRQITRLATDLAHLVTDSILREADVKKRALPNGHYLLALQLDDHAAKTHVGACPNQTPILPRRAQSRRRRQPQLQHPAPTACQLSSKHSDSPIRGPLPHRPDLRRRRQQRHQVPATTGRQRRENQRRQFRQAHAYRAHHRPVAGASDALPAPRGAGTEGVDLARGREGQGYGEWVCTGLVSEELRVRAQEGEGGAESG